LWLDKIIEGGYTLAEGEEVIAYAWKVSKNNPCYRLQISNISGKRMRNKIFNQINGWNNSGEGFDSKNNQYVLIFDKKFESPGDWLTWAQTFPYQITEIGVNNGKEKVINKRRKRDNPRRK
tara:strand:+ start:1577 stop:1939 length:363 start_codon:yes stop_codon:yes gene_type:complete